jgi:hypothetical protein
MPEPLIATTIFNTAVTKSPALGEVPKETAKTLLPWM